MCAHGRAANLSLMHKGPRQREVSSTQHTLLVERVVMLRSALKGITADNSELRRQLARLLAENRRLRAEALERDLHEQLGNERSSEPREAAAR